MRVIVPPLCQWPGWPADSRCHLYCWGWQPCTRLPPAVASELAQLQVYVLCMFCSVYSSPIWFCVADVFVLLCYTFGKPSKQLPVPRRPCGMA
jgi:hypothetical protein